MHTTMLVFLVTQLTLINGTQSDQVNPRVTDEVDLNPGVLN